MNEVMNYYAVLTAEYYYSIGVRDESLLLWIEEATKLAEDDNN